MSHTRRPADTDKDAAYAAWYTQMQQIVAHFTRSKYEWYVNLLQLRDLYGMDPHKLQLDTITRRDLPHFSNGGSLRQRNFCVVAACQHSAQLSGGGGAELSGVRRGPKLLTMLQALAPAQRRPATLRVEGSRLHFAGSGEGDAPTFLDDCFPRVTMQWRGATYAGTRVGDVVEVAWEDVTAAHLRRFTSTMDTMDAARATKEQPWRARARSSDITPLDWATLARAPPHAELWDAGTRTYHIPLVEALSGGGTLAPTGEWVWRPRNGKRAFWYVDYAAADGAPRPPMHPGTQTLEGCRRRLYEGELAHHAKHGWVRLYAECADGQAWVRRTDHLQKRLRVALADLHWPAYAYDEVAAPQVGHTYVYRNEYRQPELCVVQSTQPLEVELRGTRRPCTREQLEHLRRWEVLYHPAQWMAMRGKQSADGREPDVTRWRQFCRGAPMSTSLKGKQGTFRAFERHGRLMLQHKDAAQPLEVIGSYREDQLHAGGGRQRPVDPHSVNTIPTVQASKDADGTYTAVFYGHTGRDYSVKLLRDEEVLTQWFRHDQDVTESEAREVVPGTYEKMRGNLHLVRRHDTGQLLKLTADCIAAANDDSNDDGALVSGAAVQATVQYPNRTKFTWKRLRVPAVRADNLKMVVLDITPRGRAPRGGGGGGSGGKQHGKQHAPVAWPDEKRYEETLLRAAYEGNPVSGDKLHQLLRKQYVGVARTRVVAWVRDQPEERQLAAPPAAAATGGAGNSTTIYAGGASAVPHDVEAVEPTAPHQHQVVALLLLHKRTLEPATSPLADVADHYSVLVVVDAFSQFAWMRLLTGPHAPQIKEAMIEIWQNYHPPRILQTDEGKHAQHTFEQLCRDFAIDARRCSSRYSQCRRVVTTVQRALQRALRRPQQMTAVAGDAPVRLTQKQLTAVAFRHNATPQSAQSSRTPFQVHMGVDADLHVKSSMVEPPPPSTVSPSMAEPAKKPGPAAVAAGGAADEPAVAPLSIASSVASLRRHPASLAPPSVTLSGAPSLPASIASSGPRDALAPASTAAIPAMAAFSGAPVKPYLQTFR